MENNVRKIIVLLVSLFISGLMSVSYAQAVTDTTNVSEPSDSVAAGIGSGSDSVAVNEPTDTVTNDQGDSVTVGASGDSVTVEPVDPTDTAVVIEPIEPTDTVVVVDPIDPTDSVVVVDPTDPTDSVVVVDPTDPTDTVVVVDPSDPTDSVVVVDPIDPTDSVEVVDPTDPTDSVEVVDPTDPTDSVVVVDPTDPTDTVVVVEPVDSLGQETMETITELNNPDSVAAVVKVNVPDSVTKPVIVIDLNVLQTAFGAEVFADMTAAEIDQSVAWYFREDKSLKMSSDWILVGYGRECPVTKTGNYQAEIVDASNKVIAVTDIMAVTVKSAAVTSANATEGSEPAIGFANGTVTVNFDATISVYSSAGMLVAQGTGTQLVLNEGLKGNFIVVAVSSESTVSAIISAE